MNLQKQLKEAENQLGKNISNLQIAICDLNGIFRGKRISAEKIEELQTAPIGMPLCSVLDIWGNFVEGNSLVTNSGDKDFLHEPTERGLVPVDWNKNPTAFIPLWLLDENAPDSRRALKKVLDNYKKKKLTPVVATELEFYLYNPNRQDFTPPFLPNQKRTLTTDLSSIKDLDDFDFFLEDVYQTCKKQNIKITCTSSEDGIAQFEINFAHSKDCLKIADDTLLFKRLVRGVAQKHSLAATFIAKPHGEWSGSGCHVHFSLLDEKGQNVFSNVLGNVLDRSQPASINDLGSPILQNAVAGLLEAMPESTLLFAPHLNSYRRLAAEQDSPSAIAWGYDNRTTAIRIPKTNSKRIEHRVAGADSNPYLVLAAILGAALEGIEKKIQPPKEQTGTVYSLDLPSIPQNWENAIFEFEKGSIVKKIFSDSLRELFALTKKQENKIFLKNIDGFELQSYINVV